MKILFNITTIQWRYLANGHTRERKNNYRFENCWPELLSWCTSACRFGFFNIDTLNENYRVNRESFIENLEICLTQKLIEKKDDIKYKEEVLKPNLKIFLNSLNKRNLEELEKIMTRLEEE